MEEKIMFTKIIGAIIGALVFGAGIYYLLKEKDDKEARKIYTIISVIGFLVFAVSLILTFFN